MTTEQATQLVYTLLAMRVTSLEKENGVLYDQLTRMQKESNALLEKYRDVKLAMKELWETSPEYLLEREEADGCEPS